MTVIDRDHHAPAQTLRDLAHPATSPEIDFRSISFGKVNMEPPEVVLDLWGRQVPEPLDKTAVLDINVNLFERILKFLDPMDGKRVGQLIAEKQACDAVGRPAVDIFKSTHPHARIHHPS